ncbi:hypothetical protein GCM10010121_065900 [Streptomyces brasiliensis]|uniref:Uncharacterized protein n=1 Tax=Streptomyces brasiliensis TaxID=1954 RepID=A0A917L5A0_9ACTN|nr:hypothetical protein GCM10010121_065900 [Streptomyces brasiliensis]
MRREAGAQGDRRGHDAPGGHPRHVHNVVAVEDAQRSRLPCPCGELLQVWLRDLRQRQAREVGVAEFQDAWAEPEQTAVRANVSEVGQGQQEAAGRGAGEVAGAGDLTEGQFGVIGVEGADDGQAAFEGPDEVGLTICCGHTEPPISITVNNIVSTRH